MRKSNLNLICIAALIAAPAAAQDKQPGNYDRAIAAGYKALTLCSGIFNAGRTQKQIEALELTGTYPEYNDIIPTLTANIVNWSVEIPYDTTMPPRHADWEPGKGCSIAPIGSPVLQSIMVREMPGNPAPPPELLWPQGNAGVKIKKTTALENIAAQAFTNQGFEGRTTAVVIVKGTDIIAEHYAEGFGPNISQRTWSVAKSISATLAGIAVQRGLIQSSDPAHIPEWQAAGDPRQKITLDNLLRMASGLHSDTAGNRTDAVYFGGTAVTEQTTGLPLEAMPGTRFRYANNDSLLAVRSLRAVLDQIEYAHFPRTALFTPLGMVHSIAETDWKGNFILSSQLWSTARDLARFGMLYLNNGVWNGKRILPENWVKYVTTPSGPQPDGPFGYGAGFWLMHASPGVPSDTFAAFGNRGQYVVIIPSRNIVIVRRGEDPAGARFDIAKFTADILAAIK